MAQYPKISKGLGKLTPTLWARLMAMLKVFEESNGDLKAQPKQPGLKRPYFLAKITGSAEIDDTDNRYEYEWTEVVLNPTSGFEVRSNGRTGTDALNLCEMSNTADNVAPAVDMNGSAYPSGFTMRAIGSCIDSVQVDTLVVLFGVRDSDGVLRSVFSQANAHDGTC